mmetsp:Transcript_142/g.145  ORF Transcript_142/g.145 Transcript_142/m.145 type:complete len:324 (-) Transcript_142:26-997(-)
MSSGVVRNEDLLALQSYVTSRDHHCYENVGQTTIILDLTHSNLIQKHIEIRFDLHDTVEDLRQRIYQKTGTSHFHQHLQIYNTSGDMIGQIPPSYSEHTKLGFFSLVHGMRIHCVDLNPHSDSKNGGFENTNLIAKYRMSEDDYDKRKGTLRSWNRQKQEQDPTFSLAKHAKQHRELMEARRMAKLKLPLPPNFEYNAQGQVIRIVEEPPLPKENSNDTAISVYGEESVDGIQVGMRCQVQPGKRRGKVAFVGLVPEIGGGGHWVGIIFDEPVGKTNGTVKNIQYFEAINAKHGGFIRGKNIQVGDFPERDIMDDETDSEDEL